MQKFEFKVNPLDPFLGQQPKVINGRVSFSLSCFFIDILLLAVVVVVVVVVVEFACS